MRAGEEDFRRLVDEHKSMVFSIVLRILGERGAAEEAAQDVFLELHASLKRLESDDHVVFWLRRVAVHRATDCLRRRAHHPEAGAEEWQEERHAALETPPSAGALEMRVEAMLLSLPENLRAPTVLRYQEGLEPEEIARLLSQPVATVRSNLQRAIELLRRKSSVVLKEFIRGSA